MKVVQELVSVKAADGVLLPAMLYEPEKRTRRVLILLHGNGSSNVFRYSAGNLIMAEGLAGQKISYLALNNRGAHLVNRLRKVAKGGKIKKIYGGMAYEKIKDCVKDIDGAINFLKKRGYRQFYLIGFSTGANKICLYDYYKKNNPVSKYILVGGGDDSGIYYNQFGKEKFLRLLKEARNKIRLGHGMTLVPYDKVQGLLFSYASLWDIMNPDGAYNVFPFHYYFHKLNLSKKKFFKEFKNITKPVLTIYGEKDEYAYGRVGEIVKVLKEVSAQKKNKNFLIFKKGDHSLNGQEKKLANEVVKWLA